MGWQHLLAGHGGCSPTKVCLEVSAASSKSQAGYHAGTTADARSRTSRRAAFWVSETPADAGRSPGRVWLSSPMTGWTITTRGKREARVTQLASDGLLGLDWLPLALETSAPRSKTGRRCGLRSWRMRPTGNCATCVSSSTDLTCSSSKTQVAKTKHRADLV